jgi:hypothetical protein
MANRTEKGPRVDLFLQFKRSLLAGKGPPWTFFDQSDVENIQG